jgi:hypothetical protein
MPVVVTVPGLRPGPRSRPGPTAGSPGPTAGSPGPTAGSPGWARLAPNPG